MRPRGRAVGGWWCVVLSSLWLVTTAYPVSVEPVEADACAGRRVFVYEVRGTMFYDAEDDGSVDSIFGASLDGFNGTLRATEWLSAGRMVQHRLETSPCRVTDATQADVLYFPLFPGPKKRFKDYIRFCNVTEAQVLAVMEPHLTLENACRHFMLVVATFRMCSTGTFWYAPRDPRLQKVAHLALDEPVTQTIGELEPYQHFVRRRGLLNRCRWAGLGGSNMIGDSTGCQVEFPNVYSVPHPSSVHWLPGRGDPFADDDYAGYSSSSSSDDGPLMSSAAAARTFSPSEIEPSLLNSAPARHAPRRSLMLFIGHVGGHLQSGTMRGRMHEMGSQYADESIYRSISQDVAAPLTLLAKRQSVFCLEPGGDWPLRKSMSDSIAFGCVPVLFGNVTSLQLSHFWNDKATVVVDYEAFVSGNVDLRTLLERIARTDLDERRAELAKIKKKFTFSVTDDRGDGIDVMLDIVHQHSRSGVCCAPGFC